MVDSVSNQVSTARVGTLQYLILAGSSLVMAAAPLIPYGRSGESHIRQLLSANDFWVPRLLCLLGPLSLAAMLALAMAIRLLVSPTDAAPHRFHRSVTYAVLGLGLFWLGFLVVPHVVSSSEPYYPSVALRFVVYCFPLSAAIVFLRSPAIWRYASFYIAGAMNLAVEQPLKMLRQHLPNQDVTVWWVANPLRWIYPAAAFAVLILSLYCYLKAGRTLKRRPTMQ